jgi:hypothetical protein
MGLAILVAVGFTNVAFGWRSFFTRDFANFSYPIAYHVQQSYRAGEIPLWNPYNVAGLPFLAQWNTLTLYPLSLVYVLLPLPWSLNFFNLLHLYLGGLGMFCLARRWMNHGAAAAVAGVGYAFGGLLVSALMWPNNIAALGWLPLVLMLGERAAGEGGRSCVRAGLVTALQFLCGAPEITALTWAGLLALVVFGQEARAVAYKRRLARLTLVFAATMGLGAIQFVPFLELLRLSQRGPRFDSGAWSLAWSGLGNLLVPLFHTVQSRDRIFFQAGQQWVTSYYPAITIVLPALMALCSERARQVRLLAALTIVSLLLALGSHALVYDMLRKIMPLMGLMRYPVKFIVPVAVALPLLAGYGVRGWLQGKVKNSTAAALALGVAGLSLVLMGLERWQLAPGEASSAVWRSGLVALGCLGVLATTLVWMKRARSPDARWLAPLALVLVIYSDLLLANRHVNPVVHSQLLTGRVVQLDPQPALGHSRVMVTAAAQERLDSFNFTSPEAAVQIPRRALLLNDNLLERIPKLDGFFSLYLPRTATVVVRLAATTNSAADGLLDFLGVSHLSRPGKPWEWDARTNWLPLAALVPGAVFLDPTNMLNMLFSGEFDPRQRVCLPPEAAGQIRADGAGHGRIFDPRVSAHGVEAGVETDFPMLFTLAQANYPGWRATIDGQPGVLWTANYGFQALEVPAGRHEVRVVFRPRSFELGAVITGISLLAIFLWDSALRKSSGRQPRRIQANRLSATTEE